MLDRISRTRAGYSYPISELGTFIPSLCSFSVEFVQGRGKIRQHGSKAASKAGTVAKQPTKNKKGFSDDNASWLKPTNAPKTAGSDMDSLSDGDIMDDEFDLEDLDIGVASDSGSEERSEDGAGGSDMSGGDQDDAGSDGGSDAVGPLKCCQKHCHMHLVLQ